MSRHRHEPSATSRIQLASEPNAGPHHCGYCDTNGSYTAAGSYLASSIKLRKVHSSSCGYCLLNPGKISFGIIAASMLVDDYQLLMDRGWRKCGTYYYKALMDKTCCPLYTIRCDANNLELSRSQRKVILTMNQFINDNVKPGEQIKDVSESKVSASSTHQKKQKPKDIKSTSTESKTINSKPSSKINLGTWIQTQPSTKAIELLQHILSKDSPPSDEFLKQLKSRQTRWYKKLLRLKQQNKLSLDTDVNLLIKRLDRMNNNTIIPLEQLLRLNENPKNRFNCRLLRSYPPSEDFLSTLKESHAVYQRYQMKIHGDSPSACSFSQFKRFLCESTLEKECPRIPSSKIPACGYGSFHLQYYLNGKIIACSVIDILPAGVSSVYFYYEPDFGFLKLGVYSALKELELTRQLSHEVPDIKFYYLGFYVHTCVKMRYKGQYKPSFLLCPEAYTWHRIEKCIPLLNANKYARFESNPNKVDENEETNIAQIKLQVGRRQMMTPEELQGYDTSFFSYIVECLQIFAKFAGRTCTNRMIINFN